VDNAFGGSVILVPTNGKSLTGTVTIVKDSGATAVVTLGSKLDSSYSDQRLQAIMSNSAGRSNQAYISGLIKLGVDTCGGCVNARDSACSAANTATWTELCWAIAKDRCTPPCGCEYGAWSAWTVCDRQCGGGVQSRTRPSANRFCTVQQETQKRVCNTFSCLLNAGTCAATTVSSSTGTSSQTSLVSGISGSGTLAVTANSNNLNVISAVSAGYQSPSSTATINYNVAANAPTGTYYITVTARDGNSYSNTTTCAVTVQSATFLSLQTSSCQYVWSQYSACDASCKQYRTERLQSGPSSCPLTRGSESSTCPNCAADSCATIRCGLRSKTRDGCSCDSQCNQRGDCCSDITTHCKPYSCQGNCNARASSNKDSCWCDSTCDKFNDCCTDYYQACGVTTSSCTVIGCGFVSQHGTCACDSECKARGDCCADYSLTCTATVRDIYSLNQKQPATGSSNGCSDQSDITAACPQFKSSCKVNEEYYDWMQSNCAKTCCESDLATVAPPAGPPAQPAWFGGSSFGGQFGTQTATQDMLFGTAPAVDKTLSCQGKCGGEVVGPSGSCWCDIVCTSDDCCSDKPLYCAD